MNQKLPKNTAFRLLFPLIYGTIVYILVLLVFENFESVFQSFFNNEWIFTILLSYLSSELVHRICNILASKRTFTQKFKRYLILQFTITILAESILVFIAIHIYFIWVEGFSVYYTELIVFEMFFLFSILLYNLFIFSYLLLHQENNLQYELQEEHIRKNELMIQSLQNQIELGIFFRIMEVLIIYCRTDETKANEIIARLSTLYRNRLENKHDELVIVSRELKSAENLMQLYQYIFPGSLYVGISFNPDMDKFLILPGWLHRILITIVKSNIITPVEKFTIELELSGNFLILKHLNRQKLLISEDLEIEKIAADFIYFTDKKISIKRQNGNIILNIPLFEFKASLDEEIELAGKTNC